MMEKKRNFTGHGNRLDNPEPHHLYEIRDSLEDDVFKYGISAKPNQNFQDLRISRIFLFKKFSISLERIMQCKSKIYEQSNSLNSPILKILIKTEER